MVAQVRKPAHRRGRNDENSQVWIKFFLTISFLAFVLVTYALFKETYKKYQIQKEVEELQSEADSLKQGNEKLKGLIDYFQTQNFSEKEARGKLNVKKDGEKIVILKREDETEDAEGNLIEAQDEEVILDLPNPLKWWDYFFK